MKKIIKYFLNKTWYIKNLYNKIDQQGYFNAGHYYSPIPHRKDIKLLKNKNDSAICVRGEDKFNNFKIDKIAKTDFDYTAYGNLLDLNKQYIQTQNKKQILN